MACFSPVYYYMYLVYGSCLINVTSYSPVVIIKYGMHSSCERLRVFVYLFIIYLFIKIYAEDLTAGDERIIIGKCFSTHLDEDVIAQMVAVKETIIHEISTDAHFATNGAPFEFNLRDLLRWAELTVKVTDLLIDDHAVFNCCCIVML